MKNPELVSAELVKSVIDIQNLDYYFGSGYLKKQILFNINLTINARDYRDWETDRKSTRLNSSH